MPIDYGQPYLSRRRHGYHCRHWCAVHWTDLGSGLVEYPILMPGKFKYIDFNDPIDPLDENLMQPRGIKVHCGPGGQYPRRLEWHNHG